MAQYLAQARAAVATALVQGGLFPDEAQALVNTWNHSYFQTIGLRLLWVLPQAWTDALLPLTVTPKPAATVRVLVGRREVLTPEAEQALSADVDKRFGAIAATQLPTDEVGRNRAAEAAHALVAAWQPHAEAKLWATCRHVQADAVRAWCALARQVAHAN